MNSEVKNVITWHKIFMAVLLFAILIILNLGFNIYGIISSILFLIALIILDYYRLFCVDIYKLNKKKQFIVESIFITIAILFFCTTNFGSILYFFMPVPEGKHIFDFNILFALLGALCCGVPVTISWKKILQDAKVVDYMSEKRNNKL